MEFLIKNPRVSRDSSIAAFLFFLAPIGMGGIIIHGMYALREGGNLPRAFLVVVLGSVFFGVMIRFGAGLLSLGSHYKKIATVLGKLPPGTNQIGIGYLVRECGQSLDKLSPRLYHMMDLGYFPGMSIDLDRKTLVIIPSGDSALEEESAAGTIYNKKLHLRPVTLVSGLMGWMLALQFCPIDGFVRYLVAFAGVIVAVLVAKYAAPNKKILTVIPRPPEKQRNVSSGNDELDRIINSGAVFTAELAGLDGKLPDGVVKWAAGEMMMLTKEIMRFLRENPEKLRQTKQFAIYFLPESVGLVRNYAELNAEPQKGENIRSSMKKIEESMTTVVDGFRREHDMLFLDKAMDISTDIEVLKGMVKQDISKDDLRL